MSKICNLPMLDLRNIGSAEAAKQIELIENVAMIIMPKDGDADVLTALTAIQKENVACIISLPNHTNVQVHNGMVNINDNTFGPEGEDVLVVNGFAITENLSPQTKGRLYVNGMVFIKKALEGKHSLSFPMVNGFVKYADFDDVKMFNNELKMDAEFLKYIKPNTLIVAGNEIEIAADVTVEMLDKVHIFVGNRIKCPANLLAYLRANAFAGNTIEADK